MQRSPIEWTDFTVNPIKYRDAAGRVVWACVHASPGCTNCYAEALAKRFGRGGPFRLPTVQTLTPFIDELELRQMLTSKAISGKRVFVGDMTDIFGPWVKDELLFTLFAAFALRPEVTWQVLTKRADRLRDFMERSGPWVLDACLGLEPKLPAATLARFNAARLAGHETWPASNVWLGVSAEDQPRAADRIPQLLQTPAAVRFVSAEPLIGPIDLEQVPLPAPGALFYGLRGVAQPLAERDTEPDDWKYWTRRCARLDWLIVGGESGTTARPCHIAWVVFLLAQCQSAGVPCFVKQLGSDARGICDWEHHVEQPPQLTDVHGTLSSVSGLPGTLCHAIDDAWWPCRLKTRSRKGSDPSEWPDGLRVREFPRVTEVVG